MTTALNGSVRFVDLHAQIRSLQPALTEAVQAVLDRGDFILGKDVELFEQEFAAYCGVPHAVGVDSGLSALELALRALRVGPGDEVITQANTFIASVGAILAVGARPVLVDCDGDGVIRPDAVRDALTPRTRAIMPVHLFGRICDIEAIMAVADGAGVPVVEDACQAFGDGGMLVTTSREVADTVRQLRNYGQKTKYQHVSLPLNHRLDTIQAAVLRVKLPHLDGWNARRQYLADAYREHLEGLPIRIAPADEEGRHVYHLFVIESEQRDRLRDALQARRIETGIHYPAPLHLQVALKDLGYPAGAFPTAERLAAESLSLPMYPEMALAQVELVAEGIRAALAG